ncbi:MAG: tetratricopeptide repeat protein [Luteitalea sp.]|nr:tetratricopeptide repeat protein [Luteitalea sp.]
MVTRFRSLGRLFLVAGVVVSVAGCNFARLKANREFSQGNEEYAGKKYREAIEHYHTVLESLPEDEIAQDDALSSVWFFLANANDNLYRPGAENAENEQIGQEAIENYELASKRSKDPKYQKLALQYLFGLYRPDKMDRPDEAERIGKTLISSDPDDLDSYRGLARLYLDIGDPESSVATLQQALERSPDDVNLLQELAETHNKGGKFDDAVEIYERVADLQPRDPVARLRLAQFFQEKADKDHTLSAPQRGEYIERGIEATDRALQVKPDYFEAFVYKRILLNLQAKQTKNRKEYDAIMKQADEVTQRIEQMQKKQGDT